MELYKWYKGDELPTEECDCVVVLKRGAKYLTHVIIAPNEQPFFVAFNISSITAGTSGMIANKHIIAWMPIKYPKEVKW